MGCWVEGLFWIRAEGFRALEALDFGVWGLVFRIFGLGFGLLRFRGAEMKFRSQTRPRYTLDSLHMGRAPPSYGPPIMVIIGL